MNLKKLDIYDHKEVSFVENLYIESFPISERRPSEAMFELYKNNSKFSIMLIQKDEQYMGFLTYWDLGEFIFAEHFAISPEFRNGGNGGKVMVLFIPKFEKPIILEVELPTTIISERRIGFYQRLGFRLWDNIQYQQPAYHEEEGAIPMKLMSIGNIDIEKNIKDIRSLIYEHVYNC